MRKSASRVRPKSAPSLTAALRFRGLTASPTVTSLFKDSGLVAPDSRDSGCFHTRWPATDDGDSYRAAALLHISETQVVTGRIYRASHILFRHQGFLPAAGEAGNTPADLLGFTEFDLKRQVRVGEHLAAEAHHIGLTFGKHLLAELGIPERVAIDHRNVYHLLDCFGSVHRPAFGALHGVEAGAGAFLNAHAQVQSSHPYLPEGQSNLFALLNLSAAGNPLQPPCRFKEPVYQLQDLLGVHGPDFLTLLIGVFTDDLVPYRPWKLEYPVICGHDIVPGNSSLPARTL